jgi:hypothetical protein
MSGRRSSRNLANADDPNALDGVVGVEEQRSDHDDLVVGRRGQALGLGGLGDGELGVEHRLDVEHQEGLGHARASGGPLGGVNHTE